MIVVIGYMHVEPNEFEQFFDDLEVLATAARKRMGNISFDAAASDAKIGRLLIAERWSNQAALTAHLDATDTVDFVRLAASNVGRYPKIRRFKRTRSCVGEYAFSGYCNQGDARPAVGIS